MVGAISRIGLVDFVDESMKMIGIDKWLVRFHWWEHKCDCCRWIGLSISLMWLWVLCSIVELGLAISMVSWCIVCYRWSWLVDVIDELVSARRTISVLLMSDVVLFPDRLEMFNVNLAHSFTKHHDVNSTDFISRRSIWQELNPHAQPQTPSVGS